MITKQLSGIVLDNESQQQQQLQLAKVFSQRSRKVNSQNERQTTAACQHGHINVAQHENMLHNVAATEAGQRQRLELSYS